LEPIYTWNLVLFHQQVNLTFRRGLMVINHNPLPMLHLLLLESL